MPASVPNLAAYAAYDNGVAKRVAIANLDYWNSTSSGTTRPQVSLDIKTSSKSTTAKVTYLTSELGAGADASTMSYAGSQWTYASNGVEVPNVKTTTKNVTLKNGVATVVVKSSEAAIVEFL